MLYKYLKTARHATIREAANSLPVIPRRIKTRIIRHLFCLRKVPKRNKVILEVYKPGRVHYAPDSRPAEHGLDKFDVSHDSHAAWGSLTKLSSKFFVNR